MRVTNNMQYLNTMVDVQNSMRRFAESQAEMSSGKKLIRPSDAPVAAKEVLLIERETASIEQYEQNIASSRYRLGIEESALNQIGEIIGAARDVGLQESNDSRNATTRAAGKNFIDQMIEQVIGIANTRSGSEYLFGGHLIDAPPMDSFGNYVGDNNTWDVEIKKGFTILPNQNGQAIFVDTGLVQNLQDLSTALGINDANGVRNATNALRDTFGEIQNLLSDVGGRTQQMEAVAAEHDTMKLHLAGKRSAIQDSDYAESFIKFTRQQNLMQAALLAASKAAEMSTLQYFR